MKEELTKDQRKQLDKIALNLAFKSIFAGIETACLCMLMNIILVMGVAVFLEGDKTVATIGSVFIGIFVFRRMSLAIMYNIKQANEAADKVVKK